MTPRPAHSRPSARRRAGNGPARVWLRAGLAAPALLALLLIGSLASAAREALPRGAPGSRLSGADGATEYWDLLAQLDSGHRVFARFSITNEGPGSETAYAVGHVITPDGRSYPFQNGRRKGRWSLSPDGLHLKIGSSELFQRDPTRRLWIHRHGMGVVLDLHFTPPAPLGRPGDLGGSRYWTDVLHLAAPVEGTLWLLEETEQPVEVRGRIAATHTWMEQSEPSLALRRIEFFSLQTSWPLYFAVLTPPDGAGAQRLLLEDGDRLAVDTGAFEVRLSDRPGPATRAGYPVPSGLEIRGPNLEGRLTLGALLLQNDPMELIPQPFRWFLSFKMRPHRVWIETEFEVRLRDGSDDPYRKLSGSGVTAVSFLEPLDLGS